MRIKGPLAAVAAASTMALAACATGADHSPPAAMGRGHELAKRACAACHAVEPGGASPDAAAPAFASLEMRHTASLEGRVAELTRRGHYRMPPIKLREDEIHDLVTYIAGFDAR